MPGSKESKQRVTLLFCCNLTGDERLPVLAIGRSKRPICFRNRPPLPVDYASSANAWMTGAIFNDWLVRWNHRLRAVDRRILLLLDNFSGHEVKKPLSNITLMYFPPNTTSKSQVCFGYKRCKIV